jgi:hypothetical protein
VTGLVVVISIVIARAFFGNKLRMEDIATVGGPVFSAKRVVVHNLPMDNNEGLRIKEFVFHWNSEDYRLGMFLPVLDGLEALSNLPIWEEGSCLNFVISMAGCVSEIQRLPFFKNAYYDIPMHVLGWSLPSVNEFRGNQERLVDSKREASLHEFERYPSSFINSKISICIHDTLVSIIGYILISTPDGDSCDGVDAQNKKTKTLQFQRPPIYAVALYIYGYLGLLVGCGGVFGAGTNGGIGGSVSS